jgi:hypothetical protein
MLPGLIDLVVDLVLIAPVFAIIINDFPGGRFNFRNFFESLPEPRSSNDGLLPPPPSEISY